MVIRKTLFGIFASLLVHSALAQNELDALRYSMVEPLGSARFGAMGGAFSALGGDLSAVSWNPASIAIYRRNDLSLGTSIGGGMTRSTYNDSETRASAFQFHIPNAGIAVVNRSEDPDWRFLNYGVTFTKLVNFNSRFTVRGEANNTTLLDVFAQQANGTPYEFVPTDFPFGAGLAWNTFLLDTIPNTVDQYLTAIPFGSITQEMTIESSGHMSETAISVGANYTDRLYIGGSLGFPSVRYNQSTTYREFDTDEGIILEDYTYTDELVITGSGINLKLGAIFRASQWMRVSAAWHSRTNLSLNDVWDTRMVANFGSFGSFDDGLAGNFDYRISTPSRLILGTAFIIGRSGIISADYERVNYGSAELRPSNFAPGGVDFSAENEAISSLFRTANNVRIGTEWRFMQHFRARAGYAFQQNPYLSEAASLNSHINIYSMGLGYRGTSFYAEFAYQLGQSSREFYIYDPQLVNAAEIRQNRSEVFITLGLRY